MKLIFLAMLLFLWVSPMSVTSTNVVIRVKQNAFDCVIHTQKELLQKALSNVSLPILNEKKESDGGLIHRIINNRNVLGVGDTVFGKVMNLKEVKAHHVKIPNLAVKLVPDVGLHMCMGIDYKVSGKHVIFGDLEIKLGATILADIKNSKTLKGNPDFTITDCEPIIRDMDIAFGFGLLNAVFSAVQGQVREMVGKKFCEAVPSVLEQVNEEFAASTEKIPIGDDLYLQYTLQNPPVFTGGYMEMHINAEYMVNDQVVELPIEAQEFTMPAGLGDKEAMINLALSKDYFSLLYTSYQKSREFDLEIPSTTASLANQMSTSALGAYIPEVNSRYPQPLPVDMNIVLSQTPVVTIQNNQLILQISPYMEMFVVVPNDPYRYQHLFTVSVGASLVAALIVEEEKLKTSVSLQGDLKLIFESVSFEKCECNDPKDNYSENGKPLLDHRSSLKNASCLSDYIRTVFEKAYLPHINDILTDGVPLPKVPNIRVTKPVIDMGKNIVAISCDIQYTE